MCIRDSIYSTVPVSFAVAALGGEVVIDTVDGKVIYDEMCIRDRHHRVAARQQHRSYDSVK